MALIYYEIDSNGRPEFYIYSVSDEGGKGDLLATIPYNDIEDFLDTPPEQNTLIMRQGPVVSYVLTSGEFQFNIGPDTEGREWAIVLNLFPTRLVDGYEVGVE